MEVAAYVPVAASKMIRYKSTVAENFLRSQFLFTCVGMTICHRFILYGRILLINYLLERILHNKQPYNFRKLWKPVGIC